MSDESKPAGCGYALIVLLMLPVLSALGGLLTAVAWGWFLVPIGAPPIGILRALGIGLTVRALIGRSASSSSKKDGSSPWEQLGTLALTELFYYGLMFGIAAIIHGLM